MHQPENFSVVWGPRDWRYQTALAAAQSHGPLRRGGDHQVRWLALWLRAGRPVNRPPRRRLAAAYDVAFSPAAPALQAYVLAGLTPDQIAARLPIPAEVVKVFEAVFWDVRRFAHHRGWLLIQLQQVPDPETRILQTLALHRGADAVDEYLAGPLSPDLQKFVENLIASRTRLSALAAHHIRPITAEFAWSCIADYTKLLNFELATDKHELAKAKFAEARAAAEFRRQHGTAMTQLRMREAALRARTARMREELRAARQRKREFAREAARRAALAQAAAAAAPAPRPPICTPHLAALSRPAAPQPQSAAVA